LIAAQQIAQETAVDNVALLKAITLVGFDGTQIVEIASVGQLVEIYDAGGFIGNPLENEIRPNEPGAAGDEDEIFHAEYAAS
jgi:hypothetical protein